MGKGRDLAAQEAPEHAQLLNDMMDQLLVALVKRCPDRKMVMPISELDDTGGVVLMLRLSDDNKNFIFEVKDKQ